MQIKGPSGFRYDFAVVPPPSHKFTFDNGTELRCRFNTEAITELWLFRRTDGVKGLLTKCLVTLIHFGEAQRRADAGNQAPVPVWQEERYQVTGELTLAPLPGMTAIFDGRWPGASEPGEEWLFAHAALIPHRAIWALMRPATAANTLSIEP